MRRLTSVVSVLCLSLIMTSCYDNTIDLNSNGVDNSTVYDNNSDVSLVGSSPWYNHFRIDIDLSEYDDSFEANAVSSFVATDDGVLVIGKYATDDIGYYRLLFFNLNGQHVWSKPVSGFTDNDTEYFDECPSLYYTDNTAYIVMNNGSGECFTVDEENGDLYECQEYSEFFKAFNDNEQICSELYSYNDILVGRARYDDESYLSVQMNTDDNVVECSMDMDTNYLMVKQVNDGSVFWMYDDHYSIVTNSKVTNYNIEYSRTISDIGKRVFTCQNEIYIVTSLSVFKLNTQKAKFVEVINFSDSYCNITDIQNQSLVYSDEKKTIFAGVGVTNEADFEFDIFSRSAVNPNKEKVELSAGYLEPLKSVECEAIKRFNSDGTNNYYIKINDEYELDSTYNVDSKIARYNLERLNALTDDIANGDGPDILLNGYAYRSFLSNADYCCNLTDMISAETLDKISIFDSVVEPIYQLPVTLSFSGMLIPSEEFSSPMTNDNYIDFFNKYDSVPFILEDSVLLDIVKNVLYYDDSFVESQLNQDEPSEEIRNLMKCVMRSYFCLFPVRINSFNDCLEFSGENYWRFVNFYNGHERGLTANVDVSVAILSNCLNSDGAAEFVDVLFSESVLNRDGLITVVNEINEANLQSAENVFISEHEECYISIAEIIIQSITFDLNFTERNYTDLYKSFTLVSSFGGDLYGL
ncbi:MAG: hypothetical protein MJ153_03865 [Clostridia bacterium]|nr:hypothetical protein [Clostridia bacterium]